MNLQQLAQSFLLKKKTLDQVLTTLGRELAWRAKRRAKAKFGKYQSAVGDFPAWAPLTEYTLAEKAALVLPSPSPLKRSGVLQNSVQAESSVSSGVMVVDLYSDDPRMKWHELGFFNVKSGKSVPPRPVLGPAMLEVMNKNRGAIDSIITLAITPGYDGDTSGDFGFSGSARGVRRRGRR